MYRNLTAIELIEALNLAPRNYKIYPNTGWECGTAQATIVFLDCNECSIILANNTTMHEYLGLPERYKILGHGERKDCERPYYANEWN